jgi:hypothetical protein
MADPRKPVQGALKAIQTASKAADEQLAAGKLKAALEAQQAPMTRPQGTGLPLMPRDQGMYTPREQKDLPRMPTVDKARAAGKSPKYNERTQDLLDSRKARGKVDDLINKGKALDVKEWYGTEPLRQVAMDAGRTPEQFESLMAQLASASQRNPVDKQNQMGSYLYHLSETGQLPADSLLLTNKLKKALKDDPSLAEGRTLIELPKGYGSLAQGDIFNRAVMIGQGNIGEALPPNKKLGTFYENLLGNLKPVTVDVNALRGPIIEQGDPRWLASKLVEKDDKGKVINSYKPREMFDTGEMTMREAKQRPGFWEAAPKGSEYAGFEELWQRGAKRHNIEPAEAQALGWYGSADVTALKTKPENYVDNLERLIKRTAEQTGKSPTEVMNDMVTGKGFLRKDGGAVNRTESPEDMARFHKRFAMHKAIGGRVQSKPVKMAEGGRASIFDAPKMANGGATRVPPKKTEGFVEEAPKSKSIFDTVRQAVRQVPKVATSPLGVGLNAGYAGYKYLTGEDPLEDLRKQLDAKLNPPIDTGSAPAQQFEKFAKGGAAGQESPADMARFKKRFVMHKALGGAVKKPQKFDGGGIASPEESSAPPESQPTKAGLMAEFLAKMAKDQGKEELSSLKKPRALTDLLNRGVLANNPLSAGVDLFNLGLGAVGMGSEKPFLGSEHMKDLMNKTGVTSGEERPMMETALSFASPTAIIKGGMKATEAAKKAPELLNKASSAITSSKLSPLATEAKTASAGKPTGATYATKQEGPFFRVSPTTLDTSKAKNRGIREADELQGQAPLGGGAGSFGSQVPTRLADEEVARIIADPVANEPLNIAKKYTQETQGTDFVLPEMPESSLVKQSAIGRTHQLAVEGSPEYKTAVFDAYAQQMPDVLEQAGAKNYDDLMEKAYRQLAKETDAQFQALPYNFSYHRAGEGNYNSSKEMSADVHGNKHLYVFQGGDPHDFLNRVDPASGLNENEKFRAVHDLLGHAIYGNQFGPKGEETAWAIHSQMYSPLARLAMTAETRGQNSMVNYSPLNANLKAEIAKYDSLADEARRRGDTALLNEINAAKRQAYSGFQFAPQKAVLLPPEFLSTQYAGGLPDYLQAANRPVKGTETQSVLTHFSNQPDLQMLDPKKYGSGIKGAEAERLREYPGAVRDRSYFYMGEPGTVTPEPGLGVNRYRGEASSLYDITQDPLNFQRLARESNRVPFTAKYNQGMTYPLQDANDIERLVKEYGYQGMANPKATKPMAIMFKETPVRRQARGGLTLMK